MESVELRIRQESLRQLRKVANENTTLFRTTVFNEDLTAQHLRQLWLSVQTLTICLQGIYDEISSYSTEKT